MKLSELRHGDTLPGDCGSPLDHPPVWLDKDRFHRGREFFCRHSAAMLLAMHCSLAMGLSLVNLLLPLIFTGKSDTPKKALIRYFQTFLHVALWHYEDVWDGPDGVAHRSIRMVRRMHSKVAAKMNKDPNKNKLYFSQYDMALVQSGFFAAAVMYPTGFGIKCTKKELEDYVFFWRGIGYLMGVDDRYNICRGTYDDAYAISKEIEQELLLPSLLHPPERFEKMLLAYIDGSNLPSRWRLMTRESLFAFIYDGLGLPKGRLTTMNYVRYLLLKVLVWFIRWCPYFEHLLNHVIKKLVYQELRQLRL